MPTTARRSPYGILAKHQNMLVDGVATDRFSQVLVHGLVRQNQLVGLDARARAVFGGRFVFDNDLHASTGLLAHAARHVSQVGQLHGHFVADAGLLFVATAAVVNFTLPTKANGLAFRFLQTADAQLRITGSSRPRSQGERRGLDRDVQHRRAKRSAATCWWSACYTADSTLKWLVSNLGGTTATVA